MKLALSLAATLWMACTLNAQVTVIPNCNGSNDTLFLPEVIDNLTICQNFPVQLASNVSSTNTYDWSPGTALSDSTIAGAIALSDQTIKYVLTVKSASGACTWKDSVTITIIPADLNISGPDSIKICLENSVTLTAAAFPTSSNIQWSPAEILNTASGPNVTVTPTESVTVVASYAISGCPGPVLDSVYIRVDSIPALPITATDPSGNSKPFYCPGDTIYLTSPNRDGLTHMWKAFGEMWTPLDSLQMIVIASDSNWYERTTWVGACPSRIDSVFVPVPRVELSFTVTPDTICEGGTATIDVKTVPNTTLKWDMMNPCESCTHIEVSPPTSITYHVKAESDCPTGADIHVEVIALSILNPKTVVSCDLQPVKLNTTLEDMVTYEWSPPLFLDNTHIFNPTATPTQPGEFNYTVVTTHKGCAAPPVDIKLIAYQPTTVDAGAPQTICFGSSATLTALPSGVQDGVYAWSSTQGTQSIQVMPSTDATFTVTYNYGLNNTCFTADQVKITVLPPLGLSDIIAPSDSVCSGMSVGLKVKITAGTGTLTWFENGVEIAGATLDTVTVTPKGDKSDYSVELRDQNDCSAVSNTVTVYTKRCFQIPNAFTPNGDGYNDVFQPVLFGGNTQVLEFAIYDRWGVKVFDSNRETIGWDGKVDGKEAVSDVYVYRLKVRFANGDEDSSHGEVTLIR